MGGHSVITEFRAAINAKDAALLRPLLAPNSRLHASVSHEPFEGSDAVLMVFAMLLQLLDDIDYVAEYVGVDGVTLLSRGRIGQREWEGVQVLTFNGAGLISEFHDFLRPYSALSALREAAASFLSKQASSPPI